ncbi:unnamed protein product [Lasius platythorax]|uniref:Uncharacterized protein n=1 Tax=Lasius platythorax TaxID=488582 RepID=A0AAV2P3H6_9HYME
MKFLVNILLISVILAVIIIPSRVCQEKTLTNETSNETMDETSTLPFIIPRFQQKNIIVVADRNIVSQVCPEGQRKDNHGSCRQIL